MKRLLAALALSLALIGHARAQNHVAPTPAPGDNSDRIATTAFVQGAVASAVTTLPLPNGQIYIGSLSGVAVGQTMGGDCTISNSGTIICLKTSGVNFGPLATVPSWTANVLFKGNGAAAPLPSGLSDDGTKVSTSEPIDLTTQPLATEITNAGTTGTTLNLLAKLTGAGTAVITSTTDTSGILGVVIGGAGIAGNARIATQGQASCTFDGATTQNDYVINSTTVAGQCHDAGASPPTSSQPLGRVLTSNAAGGTFAMLVFPPGTGTGSGGRTVLAANTTFFVATTGTDATGCGLTAGNPCRTRQYIVNLLATGYDLAGHTATISLAHGTYNDGVALTGMLVGQTGPSSLVFQGDCTSAANTALVIIAPTTQVSSYSFSGAAATIECQKIDHKNILSLNGGADMITIGQGTSLTLGDAALFCPSGVCANGYADITFGCNINQWNDISVAFRSYITFVNDINLDQTSCIATTTGTTTSGSNTVTAVASTAGVVDYMGLFGSGIPADAFVTSFVANTSITFGCLYTTPCQASATASGVTLEVYGGGQAFLDLGNGSQAYFNTNGDPSYSILMNFATFNFYVAGFMFDNDLSGMNAGGITFVSGGLSRGACLTVEGLSVFTSYNEGSPYVPCFANQAIATTSLNTTAGSTSATVGAATGFQVGSLISDVAVPNGTWTAGSSTMTVTSNTGILSGAFMIGAGVLSGGKVTNVAGTTITVGGCGVGPRCVSGSPLYLSETASPVFFKNSCLASGTRITAISGTTITLSSPAKATCAGVTLQSTGLVLDNSVYQ